jgi:YfiH family protein
VNPQKSFFESGEHIAIALPGGRALFTTRHAGLPTARLAAELGVTFAKGRQVHGTHVQRVTEMPQPDHEADGQATALEGVAGVVLVADCLPIALIAPEAVAMVHAGWRGLAAGVVQEGVRAVRDLGAQGAIAAAIGPGAGVCCYEAGEEVHEALGERGAAARRGRNADLKAVARATLETAGVAEVHDAGLCTICADPKRFFSHRRDGGVTGRQAGIAWRT